MITGSVVNLICSGCALIKVSYSAEPYIAPGKGTALAMDCKKNLEKMVDLQQEMVSDQGVNEHWGINRQQCSREEDKRLPVPLYHHASMPSSASPLISFNSTMNHDIWGGHVQRKSTMRRDRRVDQQQKVVRVLCIVEYHPPDCANPIYETRL